MNVIDGIDIVIARLSQSSLVWHGCGENVGGRKNPFDKNIR